MITLLLVRHAMCDPVGRMLAGRMPGVHLNAEGVSQAEQLAERIGGGLLDGIYCSPRERALETAAPLARRARCAVETLDALDEMDFGAWTGCKFDELDGRAEWRRFNMLRSVARAPDGESMLEVQARAVAAVETLRARHPDGRCVVVSHGDVLRSLVAHYAGIPLDLFQRLEIAPASVSVVQAGERDIAVRSVNTLWGPVR